MRRVVVLAALLALVVVGCGGGRAAVEQLPASCAGAGFVGGAEVTDGLFAARIPAACDFGRARVCTVAGDRGPISQAIVPAGVAQDCFAFSDFAGPECLGVARVSTPPHVDHPTFRCDGSGAGPQADAGARVAVRPPEGAARIAGLRAPDPRGGAPWSLLVWRTRHGDRCYAPGQVVRRGGRPQLGVVGPGAAFRPYAPDAGGSCGDPGAGAGLLVSWQARLARPGLGPATTVAPGLAGARVREVAVRRGGGWRPLPLAAGGAFLVTAPGAAGPARLRLRVTYRDGRIRIFS